MHQFQRKAGGQLFNIVIAFALFVFASCSKQAKECESCRVTEPANKETVSFYGRAQSYKAKLGFWPITDQYHPNFYYATYNGLEGNNFSDWVSYLNANLAGSNNTNLLNDLSKQLYSATVFVSGDIQGQKVVEWGQIRGISLFVYENDKLNHSFYTINEGQVKHVRDYDAEVDGIAIPYLNTLADFYCVEGSEILTTVCLGVTDPNFRLDLNKPTDGLKWKIKQLKRKISRQSGTTYKATSIPGGGGNCGSPCPPHSTNPYCEQSFPSGNLYCKAKKGVEGDCPKAHASIVVDSIDGQGQGYYNETPYYTLRDSFLMASAKGFAYVEDYYYVGREAIGSGKFSYQLAKDLVTFLNNDVTSIVERCVSRPSSSDTLYTQTVTIKATSLINQFRTLSSDSTYLSILNDVASEITTFENTSISYIHAALR